MRGGGARPTKSPGEPARGNRAEPKCVPGPPRLVLRSELDQLDTHFVRRADKRDSLDRFTHRGLHLVGVSRLYRFEQLEPLGQQSVQVWSLLLAAG